MRLDVRLVPRANRNQSAWRLLRLTSAETTDFPPVDQALSRDPRKGSPEPNMNVGMNVVCPWCRRRWWSDLLPAEKVNNRCCTFCQKNHMKDLDEIPTGRSLAEEARVVARGMARAKGQDVESAGDPCQHGRKYDEFCTECEADNTLRNGGA